MPRGRKLRLALLVAAGLILGGTALWPGRSRTALAVPGGPVVRYIGATHGTNHTAPVDSPLVSILPGSLRDLVRQTFGTPRQGVSTYTTYEPSLAVWIESAPTAPSGGGAPGGMPIGLLGLLADANGVEAGGEQWLNLPAAILANPRVDFFSFGAVPRRSRQLTLRLYDQPGAEDHSLVGELALPNPLHGAWPIWEPERLPLTRTNEDLECTLLHLVTGIRIDPVSSTAAGGCAFPPARPGDTSGAAAVFRFARAGVPDDEWTVGARRITDATGNSLKSGRVISPRLTDCVVHAFAPVLWPDEVWDLDVWARRTETARFDEADLIVLDDIAVPPNGETNRLDRAFLRHGIEIKVESFAHQPPPSPGGHSTRDLTRLNVKPRGLPEGCFLDLVELTDQTGRELKPVASFQEGPPQRAMVWAFHSVPEGAQRLRLRLALQQGRHFRFRVQPERAPTNVAQIELPPGG
ncbi:MAG: hypothetical protein H7A45_10940 [Verrucomicrobiales bacterium]|nr:hypothetical protein [Verrucomicrobiales bacterium]MCP5526847.1 hypothetical protein [Verrucomicrobiales bacterium]